MLIKTQELATVLSMSKKSVLSRAKKEGWVYVEKGNSHLFSVSTLPLPIRQMVYNAKNVRTEKVLQEKDEFLKTSDSEREKAVWKARLIFEVERLIKNRTMNLEEFAEQYNERLILSEVFDKLGSVSSKTLYRWRKDYRQLGIDSLVRKKGTGGAGASLSDIEKHYLETFYLDTSMPSVKYAHRMLLANLPDSSCTYATARRYLQELDKQKVDLKRLGITKFSTLHQPAISQNVLRYKSLEKVVSDHHCLDMVVMYRGKLIRPWITAFQDMRSGKILGWCPSVAPSSFSILAAYYMMVMQYGVPDVCLFDNGKDYRSKILNGHFEKAKVYLPDGLSEEQAVYIEGAFGIIGSKVQFTEVYHGQSKGRLERTFGIFADYLAKPSGTYIGRDTTTRPEEVQTYYRAINGKVQRKDFPDWQWLIGSMGAVVNYINNALPSEGKGMEGKTRSMVFAENLPESVRHADKDVLILALTRGEVRFVRKGSIKINKIDYFAEELLRYNGRQVVVRQKLYTTESITVCEVGGALICDAFCGVLDEGDDVSLAIEKVRGIRQRNLKQLAELGTRENLPAPEYTSMIEVARNMYSQNDFVDFTDPIDMLEDTSHKSAKKVFRGESKKKSSLISPLDADDMKWASL